MNSPADFLQFRELESGHPLAAELFQKKFGCVAPPVPHHLAVMFDDSDGNQRIAGYVHFHEHGPVILVGGACTHGDAIRAMNDEQRAAITALGGVYFWLLKQAFAQFEGGCEAFFGYCGDARAMEVDLAAGFEPTGIQYLIARFNGDIGPDRRAELINQIAQLGPF